MADSHTPLPQPSLLTHCVQTPFVAQDPPKYLIKLGNQGLLAQDQPNPQFTPVNEAVLARDEVKPQVTPGNEAIVAAHASASSSSTDGTSQATTYKNRLQEYAHQAHTELPLYQTVNEGFSHAPKFRSTVKICGLCFTSSTTFLRRKSAEQDVARIALEGLPPQSQAKNNEFPVDECPPIPDLWSCKSILHEYAFKKCFKIPTYETTSQLLEGQQPELLQGLQQPNFVSSLILNGIRYTGQPGKNKKEAEQSAAHAAIRSLLSTADRVLYEIIWSKNISDDACRACKKVPDQNNTLQAEGSVGHNPVMPTSHVNSVQDGVNVAAHNLVMPISHNNSVRGGVNAARPNDAVPIIRGKEVQTMTPIVKSDMGSPLVAERPGHRLEPNQPHHDFKKPKLEQPSSSVTNNLPIAFVASVTAPPIANDSHRANRRQENRKSGNNKRLQAGDSQPISAVHPCPALLDRPMNAAT